MKLIKIMISQNEATLKVEDVEIAKETNQCIFVKREWTNKRLGKHMVNKIDSIFNQSSRFVSYHCYCEDDKVEEKKKELKELAKKVIDNLNEEIQNLISNIQTLEV